MDELFKARWDVDEPHGLAVLGRAHRLVISPDRRRPVARVHPGNQTHEPRNHQLGISVARTPARWQPDQQAAGDEGRGSALPPSVRPPGPQLPQRRGGRARAVFHGEEDRECSRLPLGMLGNDQPRDFHAHGVARWSDSAILSPMADSVRGDNDTRIKRRRWPYVVFGLAVLAALYLAIFRLPEPRLTLDYLKALTWPGLVAVVLYWLREPLRIASPGVELRGLEPLTPSLRTRNSPRTAVDGRFEPITAGNHEKAPDLRFRRSRALSARGGR